MNYYKDFSFITCDYDTNNLYLVQKLRIDKERMCDNENSVTLYLVI